MLIDRSDVIHVASGKGGVSVVGQRNSSDKREGAAVYTPVDVVASDGRAAVVRRWPIQCRRAVGVDDARCHWRAWLCRLGRIKSSEHAHPSALARDDAFGSEVIRSAVDAGGAYAAIIVTDHDAAFLVDRGIVEVEEVAAGTALTDTAALNRITRRDILRRPSRTTVECRRDIQIPNAGEV